MFRFRLTRESTRCPHTLDDHGEFYACVLSDGHLTLTDLSTDAHPIDDHVWLHLGIAPSTGSTDYDERREAMVRRVGDLRERFGHAR